MLENGKISSILNDDIHVNAEEVQWSEKVFARLSCSCFHFRVSGISELSSESHPSGIILEGLPTNLE